MSKQRRFQPKSALPLCLLVAILGCRSTPEERPAESSAEAASAAAEAPPAQDAAAGSQLEQDVRKLSLGEQRKVYLVQEHLENARTFITQLRLEDARSEAEKALELDPENLRAKELRAEAMTLRGDRVESSMTIAQEMDQQYQLKVQQMKAEVQDSLAKARLQVARGDYNGAIAELEIANNLVRFAPYSVSWGGLDAEAKNLLEKVRDQRAGAEQAAQRASEQRATEELRAQEAAVRDRRAGVVNGILDSAITAFQNGHYEEAEAFAKEALAKDPRNEQAREIKDAAFRAGRTTVKQEYVANKREQFLKWQEQMKELQIPWDTELTLPSPDEWNALTELRAKRRGIDLTQKMSESERDLREQLHSTLVQVSAKDAESLTKVIDQMRIRTGLPLVVDPAAEAEQTTAASVFNFSFENKITAEQALNLITRMASEKVTWTVRHDAVLITTKEKARNRPIFYSHDVRDLTFDLNNFTGPRIDTIRLLDKMQDDDGGGPFGGMQEKTTIMDPTNLLTVIQDNVAAGTWTEEGVTIGEGTPGFILINHTPEVQEQVRQFLNDLRRFSASLVTIESKFMSVSSNWIQEIGVDFRGLDNVAVTDVTNGLEDQASRGLDNSGTGTSGQNAAGHPSAGIFYDDGQDGDFRATTQNFFGTPLGSALSTIGGATFQIGFLDELNLNAILRAVEKSSNIELINDQLLSVHNTQRAYVAVINQRAYIQDFDVEVAQFQAVADPQINVLNEGIVLEVQPTIHHNRKYLTLEIQPTVAKIVALRDFSSTLGGNTSPIQFQLPEVQVQSVSTSAIIPDGGSIMLGGLSNIRNIERRAEVPWFAKIPLLGFFFKQEGYNDENRSLMILIRARITDVRDELRRIETRK